MNLRFAIEWLMFLASYVVAFFLFPYANGNPDYHRDFIASAGEGLVLAPFVYALTVVLRLTFAAVRRLTETIDPPRTVSR